MGVRGDCLKILNDVKRFVDILKEVGFYTVFKLPGGGGLKI